MLLSIHVCRNFCKTVVFAVFTLATLNKIQAQKTFGLLKKLNGNDENGYVLFSPLSCDTTYLINKCGQKVHQWVSEYTPGMSVYLLPNGHLMKTGTYTDTAFGVAGGRGGIIEEFDWNNNLVWRYKIFNDSLCQHHDLHPMPNGNVLVLAWHAISKTDALKKGRRPETFGVNQTELWGERLIELRPIGKDSAEIVWQWDLFDHIVQDYDTASPNFDWVNQHPELVDINFALTMQTSDWIHANGIDYNAQLDQIIINCHNFSEFWIIDHSTTLSEASTHRGGKFDRGGDLLYRWGNPEAYGMGTSQDRKLFRQHNAHWIPNGLSDSGCIMVFNNGLDRDTAYSTVEVIQTPILSNGSYNQNLPFGPSNSKWKYKDSIPTNFYSQIISGAERLPNGNTIICSGIPGLFFEVTPSGKTVWEYRNPVYGNGVKSDGVSGANPVFRASFYAANYPAFTGRSLYGMGVLEKNSMPYSCTYESIIPFVKSLAPLGNGKNVHPDSTLIIKMSEAVLNINASYSIFANGQLYETINSNSDLITFNGDEIQIRHTKSFPLNSRIGVKIPLKFARDSSFNYTNQGIDTIQWHFNTESSVPVLQFLFPDSGAVLVKTDAKPYFIYNSRLHKTGQGGVSIYEDGVLKEFIPVTSNRVQVSGNVIELLGTSFGYGKTVDIVVDRCLADTFDNMILPISMGQWVFNTLSRPVVESLSPAKGSLNIDPSTLLTVEFDRYMRVDTNRMIHIYVNGNLYKTIALLSSEVQSGGTDLMITLAEDLPSHSRISIDIPDNALLDNFGTAFEGLDSSEWIFTTGASSGVRRIQESEIAVFPQPVNNILVIESKQDIEKIEVFDAMGRKLELTIMQDSEFSSKIDCSSLPSGVYLVKINGSMIRKVIKE